MAKIQILFQNMKRILFILLIVCSFFSAIAQNTHIIDAKLVGGCFLPMQYYKDVENPSPQQLSVVAGFELDYNFLSFNKAGWKRHWNYPSIGFTLLGLKLNDIYGTTDPSITMMVAAYPHVHIPIYRSDIGQLGAKVGMGIAIFDKTSMGLGSQAAFNFGLSINGKIYVSRRTSLSFDATYNPMTNGNIYSPNSTMNIFYVAIGASHALGYENYRQPKVYRLEDLEHSWMFNISASISFKNINKSTNLNQSILGTLHADGLKKITNCWSTGPAIDFIYAVSNDIRLGLAWANGFTMSRATGIIDIGIHVFDTQNEAFAFNEIKYFTQKNGKEFEKLNGTLYARLGLRYRIWDNINIQVSIRSFLHTFDCAEFGIGYYLTKKSDKEGITIKHSKNRYIQQHDNY